MPERHILLRATGVTKIFRLGKVAVPALRGVDLELAAGEVVLLMGPSGSGKTTLLSILGCILTPTDGSILLMGRETAGLPEKELAPVRLAHVGFIFQGYNLFPTYTPWKTSGWPWICAVGPAPRPSTAPWKPWPPSGWPTRPVSCPGI
jgi:putative ABC transport system ATP-binding protein